MSFDYRTALQVSIYPLDWPHLRWSLPHQIRAWADQVDTILVTLDNRRSPSGRYRGEHYEDHLARTQTYLRELQRTNPKLRVLEVDYADPARGEVARRFFAGRAPADKAWDGGPFYAYFYGLHAADARYVLHIDGDMQFGGGSQRWLKE